MGGRMSGTSRKRRTLPRVARPGWLKRMDQRSRIARALHDRLALIGDDLGGLDAMSGLTRSVLERFVHVEALLQQHEQSAREGKAFDMQAYLALYDRVLRTASTLGFERRKRGITPFSERASLQPPATGDRKP
jgi:hypothetical protein